ncbi:excalibur calcium-binding domain-containing protein [Rhodococcus sp. Q]|uniref:excalibur calcium-binding domain-containing protein n=1 Tax=Rhodococcus sp. Q TaxID=2502252 RepID=UPI002015FE7B|nr:excalibur calcium-binding domain-containing protein [Rhodococcus sp. Q]
MSVPFDPNQSSQGLRGPVAAHPAPKKSTKRLWITGGVVGLLVLVGACGGENEKTSEPTPSRSTTTSTARTTTAVPSTTPAATSPASLPTSEAVAPASNSPALRATPAVVAPAPVDVYTPPPTTQYVAPAPVPFVAPAPEPAPEPEVVAPKPQTGGASYASCAAARAAGAAPLYAGSPGYSSKLDRDKDGVACES